MKLRIEYSKDKDIQNFLNGRKAINRKTNTPTEEEFLKLYDEFNKENLSLFIDYYTAKEKYNIYEIIEKAKREWSEVEEKFINRCEELFSISYPLETVTAYFSLNGRGTYNLEGKLFFLSVRSKYTSVNIMHELLHFYTWEAFGKELIDSGYDKLKYNEIKESLTVLLNLEFDDLMKGEVDSGYHQHQEMRKMIVELYKNRLSVSDIIERIKNT